MNGPVIDKICNNETNLLNYVYEHKFKKKRAPKWLIYMKELAFKDGAINTKGLVKPSNVFC